MPHEQNHGVSDERPTPALELVLRRLPDHRAYGCGFEHGADLGADAAVVQRGLDRPGQLRAVGQTFGDPGDEAVPDILGLEQQQRRTPDSPWRDAGIPPLSA
ncbi:hypothetical protein ACTMTJ_41710 [Phytohabitans sp. LJ34]|uniref:hypothetical protein n=1 Tax=Phytohabitans sp. LJ34 TaxID=3452217 RepID=UPI003F893472